MAMLFLSFAAISAAPAVAAARPCLAVGLAVNAMAWVLIARQFT